jgi:hypothetical protein
MTDVWSLIDLEIDMEIDLEMPEAKPRPELGGGERHPADSWARDWDEEGERSRGKVFADGWTLLSAR